MKHIIRNDYLEVTAISFMKNKMFISTTQRDEVEINIDYNSEDNNLNNNKDVLDFLMNEYNLNLYKFLSEKDIEDFEGYELEDIIIYHESKMNICNDISLRLSELKENKTYYFNMIKSILNTYYSLDYETETFEEIKEFRRHSIEYRSLLNGYIDFFINLEEYSEKELYNIDDLYKFLNEAAGLKSNKDNGINNLDTLKSNILLSMLSSSKYEDSNESDIIQILTDSSKCNIVTMNEPKTMKNSIKLISESVSESFYDKFHAPRYSTSI